MTTVRLNPTYDMYIDKINPETNFPNGTELYVCGGYRYYAFTQFDLGIIPYKKVINATFSYYYIRNGYAADGFQNRVGYYKTGSQAKDITHSNFGVIGSIVRLRNDEVWYEYPGNWYTRPMIEFMAPYKNSSVFIVVQFPISDKLGIQVSSSMEGSNSEYMTITYDDLPPQPPIELYPNNAALYNPGMSITLVWQHVPNGYAGDYDQPAPLEDIQSYSTVRYRLNGGAWQSYQMNNDLNTYTIPAGTFAASATGTVEWQAKTAGQYNGEGDWSAVASFTLGDTPPEKPLPLYPVNVVAQGGITFEWLYRSLYDALPAGFDLMYRIDGGAWTTVSQTTTDSFYGIPAITTSSLVDWMVRTHGAFGDVGPYSDMVSFNTAGTPDDPTILNVTNTARPVITWAAVELQSWDMRITSVDKTIEDLRNMPVTGVYSRKVKQYLPDGQYLVSIRVKNEFGFYSNWVSRPFVVSTVKPDKPELRIVDNPEYNVKLTFDVTGAFTLIYRDGLCVGKTTLDYFEDFTAQPGRRYRYFVRSVTAAESFADSDPHTGFVDFPGTTLAWADSPQDFIRLDRNLDADPGRSLEFGNGMQLVYFQGRKYPVADIYDQRSQRRSFSFYVRDFGRLEELLYSDGPLIVRDRHLGVTVGYMDGQLSVQYVPRIGGYTAAFTLTTVDRPEEVDPDA